MFTSIWSFPKSGHFRPGSNTLNCLRDTPTALTCSGYGAGVVVMVGCDGTGDLVCGLMMLVVTAIKLNVTILTKNNAPILSHPVPLRCYITFPWIIFTPEKQSTIPSSST